jgi:hypothetical protein
MIFQTHPVAFPREITWYWPWLFGSRYRLPQLDNELKVCKRPSTENSVFISAFPSCLLFKSSFILTMKTIWKYKRVNILRIAESVVLETHWKACYLFLPSLLNVWPN